MVSSLAIKIDQVFVWSIAVIKDKTSSILINKEKNWIKCLAEEQL